jgi:anti-anti-sigma factor
MPRLSLDREICIVEVDPLQDLADEKAVEQFGDALYSHVRTLASPRVVVDLVHARFIGSTVIEALLRTWKHIKSRHGKLAVCGLNAACREVLAVSKLDSLWRAYETREEAVQELSGKA